MKFSFITLILLVLTIFTLNANTLTVSENNPTHLKLHFSNPDAQAGLNTASFAQNDGFTESVITNNYNLPVINCLIQVPTGHKPVVTIINPEYKSNAGVKLYKIDEDIAVSSEFIAVSAPFVMRGALLSTLSVQTQVYYKETSELKTLLQGDIVINFVPDISFCTASNTRQTREFKNTLAKTVINYRDETRNGVAQGSLLIIYNQTASPLTIIQPLIDWKHQKGWEVHTASTATAGTTTTTIKAYIQNAYNTWSNPPEYVLLLGRVTQTNSVPTYTEFYNHNTVGDYKYVLLEGNDIIPDAYIGRLTFSSSDQLTTMINKIMAYEKKQGLTNSNWFNNNLLLSDETDSGPSCTTTIDYVRNLIVSYNPTATYTYVTAAPFPSQMSTAINSGIGNFYYRGHNGYSGMTNTDISNLINTGKYPFLGFITCFSANFGVQSELSIGEQFMRVGTASTPKGAIGFIGASCETHTCLNNIMTGALAYGFYREGLTNQGQALQRTKLGLLAGYPQYPDDYIAQNFQSINLLGDPTIDIWLKQPTDITVSYPQSVALTNGFMQVTVTDASGNPVNLAKVCLLKGNDEIFDVGYTNASGIYVFQWETAVAGTAKLTVTKPNYSTFQGNVTFSNATIPFAVTNLQSFNLLGSGTHYAFPLSLINSQYASLTNVTGTFSCTDEYVTVNSGNLSFGNMVQNQTTTSAESVDFTIAENCPFQEIFNFSLLVQGMSNEEPISYNARFSIIEKGPELVILSTQIGTDNVLVPGETSPYTLTLKNTGNDTASGISAHITTLNPGIVITQATQAYNNLIIDQEGTNLAPFNLQATQSIYTGTPVNLKIELSYNNGSTRILSQDIIIGNVNSTTMTGPDAYGYICVANSDTHPLAKPYNWVEINPALSGSGTAISLVDNTTEGSGTFSTINIPFSFKYYGVNYSQMTVCSNGFLMPGSTGSQEWMNWQIPGPMVPRPIIAPFWDDLIIQTDSRLYYWNDTVNNRFVIEWYKFKNKYNTSMQETFQVIIYNTLVLPTTTGDNALLFQYKTFNNVDTGNYGVDYIDHGQYASVGIADHTGLVGIGYTYQNTYPTTASTLSNNSTLFFTTMQTLSNIPAPQYQSYQFTETTPVFNNNQIDAGETISLTPYIVNAGSGNLESSTVVLSSADPYVTVTTAGSTLITLNPAVSSAVSTPFQFQISSDCPNLRNVTFNLQITSLGNVYNETFSILIHAPQISFTAFAVNGNDVEWLDYSNAVPISIQVTNLSNLPLNNAVFTLQNSNQWTAAPSQIYVSIPAFGIADINFNITAAQTIQPGSLVTLSGVFSLPGIYDSLFTKQLYVGQMAVIGSENFDNQVTWQGWSFSNGVSAQPATHIHQEGYEIVIAPFANNPVYTLISPEISAFNSQIIQLSFNYLNNNLNVQSNVFVSYNNSNIWQSVYCYSTVLNSLTRASCLLTNIPVDIQSVRFKWLTTYQYYNPNPVTLDDIQINAIHQPQGMISGTVNLDNFVQNVTQVRISTSVNPEVFVYPNQSGSYSLPLYQGTYPLVKAELEHFLPQVIHNVNVTSNQNSEGNDFNLSYMRKPVDITYAIAEDVLSMNWQLEYYSDRVDRVEPDYYRVYIKHNNVAMEDSTTTPSYQMNVEYGAYLVYIKSVFHDFENSQCYSDSSVVVTINYTANGEHNQTPVVFDLKQNFPNPFNPKTTISYSLNKAGATSLIIYNLKGENVRTMVSKNQTAGSYHLEFDGLDNSSKPLSSGVYFYKLKAADKTLIRKMILLK